MTFAALDSALLGPLFATADMADCFSDIARLGGMIEAEAALARAQARLGIVPDGLAAAIMAVDPGTLDCVALGAQTAVSGVPTIPFIAAMQARLPGDLARSFHKGATTQDVLDTGVVLQLRRGLDLVAADLDGILAGLMRMAETHRSTPCVGRTYGQHAAPLTFGYKVAVWLTGIADAAGGLSQIRQKLLVVSLGGPVGTLASLGDKGPAVLYGFAQELGLGTTPLAWHTLRGRVAETGSWIAILLGSLAKMATDVASLASTEVGEVAEPYMPGRGGSSAMPHKRNPVSSTVILAAHAAAGGHVQTLFNAMAAAHERPAGLWHAEWHALPMLFGLASGALREARALAEGLTADTARMTANLGLTRGLLFADAAAARLAGKLGRAEAHRLVEHAACTVRETGSTLHEVLGANPALQGMSADLESAFALTPAVAAAGLWVDRAVQHAAAIQAELMEHLS